MKNFDYFEIRGKGSMSLRSKIKLEGKVASIISDPPDINPNNGLWKVIPDENETKGFEVSYHHKYHLENYLNPLGQKTTAFVLQ